jgi:putative FmdB family regulatory protein
VPIYEYRCRACGDRFEKLVYGQAAVACPQCASGEVTRTLSLFGFKSGSTFASSAGGGAGSGGGCGCGGGGCGCR